MHMHTHMCMRMCSMHKNKHTRTRMHMHSMHMCTRTPMCMHMCMLMRARMHGLLSEVAAPIFEGDDRVGVLVEELLRVILDVCRPISRAQLRDHVGKGALV